MIRPYEGGRDDMGQDLPERRSIRLADYDYSQGGAYFVTVCTRDHRCLFGRIVVDTMELNDAGRAVEKCWHEIPVHFPQVEVDAFVVMPNHIHGILILRRNHDSVLPAANPVGANHHSPVSQGDHYSPAPSRPRGTSQTIGSIIRGFKIGVTQRMRRNTPIGDVWQRNYHEHIIRNEKSLNLIRQYITENPASWIRDRYGPGMR